jgi:hypothetical protein
VRLQGRRFPSGSIAAANALAAALPRLMKPAAMLPHSMEAEGVARRRRRSRRLDCGGFAAALVHAAAMLWRRGNAAAFQSGSDAAAVQTLRVTDGCRS